MHDSLAAAPPSFWDASLNKTESRNKQTPLLFAVSQGYSPKKIATLLVLGADVCAVDRWASDVIVLAVIHNQPMTLHQLVHAKAVAKPEKV